MRLAQCGLLLASVWFLAFFRWRPSLGGLKTADSDYAKAKRDRLIALLLGLPASFIQILIVIARMVL